ncbi:MAG: hypothetical protein AAGG55_07520 [Pseudomonadota bacterium]
MLAELLTLLPALLFAGALIGLIHRTSMGTMPYAVGHGSLPGFLCLAHLAVFCAPVAVRLGDRHPEK